MAPPKRVVLVACSTLVLMVATALPIPVTASAAGDLTVDAGLQDISLSCNDGTDLAMSLDLATAAQLSDAVAAINLNPAGDPALTCSVTQSLAGSSSTSVAAAPKSYFSALFGAFTGPSAVSAGNPNYDYAVGGGRAVIVLRCGLTFEDNFSLNARVGASALPATAQGHFNLTIPPGCTSGETGTTYTTASHLVTEVDCAVITTPTDALLTARVTHRTGLFANPAEAIPARISVAVHDSGMPGGTGDRIGWDPRGTSPCVDFIAAPYANVTNGNINVHQAP
jgi:hypothetical protein